jgi:hypothetical protein
MVWANFFMTAKDLLMTDNGITMNFMEKAKYITKSGNNYKERLITNLLKAINPIG